MISKVIESVGGICQDSRVAANIKLKCPTNLVIPSISRILGTEITLLSSVRVEISPQKVLASRVDSFELTHAREHTGKATPCTFLFANALLEFGWADIDFLSRTNIEELTLKNWVRMLRRSISGVATTYSSVPGPKEKRTQ